MITQEECNDAHDHAKRLLEQVKQADRSVRRKTVPIYSELTPGKVVGHRLVRIDRDASPQRVSAQTCERELARERLENAQSKQSTTPPQCINHETRSRNTGDEELQEVRNREATN